MVHNSHKLTSEGTAQVSIWGLQDNFHDATSDRERDEIRDDMRDAGYHGVADTIKSVDDGGTDWRNS